MTSEHPSITSFRAALERHGGSGRIVVLPDSVHTAALAAEALGCEVGAIANSLLFDAASSPVLILTSGGHPAAVFSTTYDELLTMTGAREIDVDG